MSSILKIACRRLSSANVGILRTTVDRQSPVFQENEVAMKKVVEELQSHVSRAALGGDDKSRNRHLQRGRLLARQRIDRLLDPGSPFLEFSQLAAHGLYGKDQISAAGILTGIGLVGGRFCVVIANDPTVKAGTYYPMTVKKHLRAQDIAQQNRLPCIYLVDSGGANLPRQDDVFPDKNHFGKIFYNIANLSAKNIPQVCRITLVIFIYLFI